MNTFRKFIAVCLLGVSTGTFAANCELVEDGDLFVDKDWHATNTATGAPDGRYPANGGVAPFAGIQAMLDVIEPGQCGFVRESQEPYYEIGRKSGTIFSGHTFVRGGTSDDNRVIVAGYPGERPVISSNRDLDPEGRPVAGFYILEKNYITIKNFEIRDMSSSGVMIGTSGPNRGIVVENNHIHHLFGVDNVGGVRLDWCEYCVVRNNEIHDMYGTNAGESNPFTDVPNSMHSGVHGFRPSNCIIENNLIYNVAKGVYQKEPHPDGLPSNEVRYNKFYNIAEFAYILQNMGAGLSAAYDVKFHHNLVVKALQGGVGTIFYEAVEPSKGLKVYNNTFVDTNSIVSIRRFHDVEIYNNIFYSSKDFDTSGQAAYVIVNPSTGLVDNKITFADNNLFYNVGAMALVDRYTPNVVKHFSVDSWQEATAVTASLPATRDEKSVFADPLFLNERQGDYRLHVNSPGNTAGVGKAMVGAFTGAKVGLLDDETDSSRIKLKSGVSVQEGSGS